MSEAPIELPASWTVAPLSELIGPDGTFVDGDWVESKDQDPEGEVRLIQLADIGDGEFRNRSARFLTAAKAAELRCTYLREGDLLIARMPDPLGRCCVFPLREERRYVTVVDVCIVRPGSAALEPRFLMYAINSLGVRSDIAGFQSGSTRKRISRGNLATVGIPIAPTREQHRIVAKIEELFSELDKAVESLTLARVQLKTYRQALLKAAFEGKLTADWRAANPDKLEPPETILARIRTERLRASKSLPSEPTEQPSPTEISTGWAWASVDLVTAENLIGLVRAASEQNDAGEGVSYIKMDRIDMDGRVDIAARVFVEATPAEIERYALKSGDLLFNTRNSLELVGKTGLVRSDPKQPAVYNNNLMRIRSVPAVLPGFLVYQMCGHAFRHRMERIKKATTSVAAVYGKDLWPLPILAPSIAEQGEIVRILDEKLSVVDVALSENETHFAHILALRQSVLKKAFSGQLVSQDPTDEPATALLARLREEAPAPRTRRRKTA